MRKAVMLLALAALTACGADGEPVKPTVKTQTTFGMNSESGSFSSSAITFFFGEKSE
jgi:predicted small lipoprotein YifL